MVSLQSVTYLILSNASAVLLVVSPFVASRTTRPAWIRAWSPPYLPSPARLRARRNPAEPQVVQGSGLGEKGSLRGGEIAAELDDQESRAPDTPCGATNREQGRLCGDFCLCAVVEGTPRLGGFGRGEQEHVLANVPSTHKGSEKDGTF